MDVNEVAQYINLQLQQRRQDIEDIEFSCDSVDECSFENSMNIEFYQGMIEALVQINLLIKSKMNDRQTAKEVS